MKHPQTIRIPGPTLLAAVLFFLTPILTWADTIKLKDGKTLEGVITLEAADMVKIKVQKSATISETVTVMKSDIAEIQKSAPDDVAFAKLQNLLPTGSLIPTSRYRTMIEKGPQAFLNSYPDSKHREAVEKIKVELEDELANVDAGFIKIEGEWISPESRTDFRELIAARILNLSIRQKAQSGNFIGAMRDFEKMEETYLGTPSFLESVKTIQQMLPVFGRKLQAVVRDVEFNNQQFQEDLMKMPEADRATVKAAREQEEATLKKRFEADKASGIKWYSLNQRDKADLTAYIQMVAAEIQRLNALDLATLQAQSQKLVKADELLAEEKLEEAEAVLQEVGALGSSRSSSRSSSSSKSNYPIALRNKLQQQKEAIETAAAQAKDAAEGAKATEAIRSEDIVSTAAPAEDAEGGAAAAPSGSGGDDALTDLLANAPDKAKPEKAPKGTPKKPSSKKKPADDEDEEEENKPTPKPASGGGFNLSFQKIMIGVAVLMAIAVGLMKILGIGGAKE